MDLLIFLKHSSSSRRRTVTQVAVVHALRKSAHDVHEKNITNDVTANLKYFAFTYQEVGNYKEKTSLSE